MESLHVIVDSREQKPFEFTDVGYNNVSVTRDILYIGDYSIFGCQNEIAIERKSLPDLMNCLGRDRDRFIRQLQRGRGLESYSVVIEASWIDLAQGNYMAKIHPHAACQSICSFIARMGIPFVFAGSRKAAEYIVYSILTQYANGIRRRLRAVEAAMNPIQPPQTMPRARVVRMQTMAQAGQ